MRSEDFVTKWRCGVKGREDATEDSIDLHYGIAYIVKLYPYWGLKFRKNSTTKLPQDKFQANEGSLLKENSTDTFIRFCVPR